MNATQSQSPQRPWLWIGIASLACVALVEYFQLQSRLAKSDSERAFLREMKDILPSYKHILGELPSGTNADISAALLGKNSQGVYFLKARRLDPAGALIDAWDTPYRFDFSTPEAPHVWSCGPNRKDDNGAEGSDDIVSWR